MTEGPEVTMPLREVAIKPVASAREDSHYPAAPIAFMPYLPTLAAFMLRSGRAPAPCVIEFMGPSVYSCWGQEYAYLTDAGLKEIGAPPTVSARTETQACFLFNHRLFDFIADAKQIAWRSMPQCHQTPDGGFWVGARLAVYK